MNKDTNDGERELSMFGIQIWKMGQKKNCATTQRGLLKDNAELWGTTWPAAGWMLERSHASEKKQTLEISVTQDEKNLQVNEMKWWLRENEWRWMKIHRAELRQRKWKMTVNT